MEASTWVSQANATIAASPRACDAVRPMLITHLHPCNPAFIDIINVLVTPAAASSPSDHTVRRLSLGY